MDRSAIWRGTTMIRLSCTGRRHSPPTCYLLLIKFCYYSVIYDVFVWKKRTKGISKIILKHYLILKQLIEQTCNAITLKAYSSDTVNNRAHK